MSEEIKGKCYQEHEPTPNKPCEIKTMVCNDIEIPVEFLKQNFVTVDGKKYIELQQENKQLKEVIEEVREYIESDPLVMVLDYDYYVNDLIKIDVITEGECHALSFFHGKELDTVKC